MLQRKWRKVKWQPRLPVPGLTGKGLGSYHSCTNNTKLKTDNFCRCSREPRSQGKLVRPAGGCRESQPPGDEGQEQKFCRTQDQSRETETVIGELLEAQCGQVWDQNTRCPVLGKLSRFCEFYFPEPTRFWQGRSEINPTICSEWGRVSEGGYWEWGGVSGEVIEMWPLVEPQLELGSRRLPTPPLSFGMSVPLALPIPRSCLKGTALREKCGVETIWKVRMTVPRKGTYISLVCRTYSFCSCPRQTSRKWVSLAFETCHLPIWRALPLTLVSSCPLCTGGWFQISPRKLPKNLQTNKRKYIWALCS